MMKTGDRGQGTGDRGKTPSHPLGAMELPFPVPGTRSPVPGVGGGRA